MLDRQFEAPAPNRKWVADFTYIWTAEGWLYVAAVIDLFSRRVVGWSMSASHDGGARHRRAGRWRSGGAASRASCCITPIAAANTPASSASG